MNKAQKLIGLGAALLIIVLAGGGFFYWQIKPLGAASQAAQTTPALETPKDSEPEVSQFEELAREKALLNQRVESTSDTAKAVAAAAVIKPLTTPPATASRSTPAPVVPVKTPPASVSQPPVQPPAPQPVPDPAPDPAPVPQLTKIIGSSRATAAQLEKLMHLRNPAAPNLSGIYFEMEKIYGIRADLAFLQMVKETNALKFTGDVSFEQHNPAGIGATGGGAAGASFASWQEGIEAQFQHLLAYASTSPIPAGRAKLDPRFDLVKRGSAPYVEWLGKADNPNGTGWAWPGDGYGASIIKLQNEALQY